MQLGRVRISFVVVVIVGFGLAASALLSHLDSPERRFQRALAALEAGDLNEVSKAIRSLQREPDFEPHVSLLSGGLLLRSGHHSEALYDLATTEPQGLLRAPALLLTGECLYRLGRLAEAETMMRTLVAEQPDHRQAHRWLGAIYYDIGSMEHAVAELETLTRLEPNDYAPHRLLGLIYFDFEQYPRAIKHYRRALTLRPRHVQRNEILRELAESLIHQHEYPAALETLKIADTNAHILSLQSECFWSQGDSMQARELLERARALDPDERSLLLLDARMQLVDGNPELVVAPLKRTLAHDPHDYECRYQLAEVYRKLGRTLLYQSEIASMNKSKALRERLSELNKLAISSPRDAAVRDELADICKQLGKSKLSSMWKQAADACRQGILSES